MRYAEESMMAGPMMLYNHCWDYVNGVRYEVSSYNTLYDDTDYSHLQEQCNSVPS